MIRSLSSTLTLSLLLIASASAQTSGGQWESLEICVGTVPGYPSAFPGLGQSLVGMGDVDGDGVPDFAAGSRMAYQSSLYSGAASVYSGASGALIRRHFGPSFPGEFGTRISNAGDVDGDGVDDLLVGAREEFGDAGAIYVYSGATGALVHHIQGAPGMASGLGTGVAGLGDFDGDGHDDFATTASNSWGFGVDSEILVYSGANGTLLSRIDCASDSPAFGASISVIDDLDGDGQADLIAGDPGGFSYAGQVTVFSGATGLVLWRVVGETTGYDRLGQTVAVLGDLDGDGYAEFATNRNGPAVQAQFGTTHSGVIRIYSGRTGAVKRELTSGVAGVAFGQYFAAVGDVNGDGFPNLLASSLDPNGNPGYELISLEDGRTLQRFEVLGFDSYSTTPMAPLGDVDRDGIAEFIYGTTTPNGEGAVHRVHFDSLLHPSTQELSISAGVPLKVELLFPASEAGHRYALLASRSGTTPTTVGGLPVPLAGDRLLTSMLFNGPPSALTDGRGVLDGAARATATLTPTQGMAPLIGTSLYFAALTFDPLTYSGRVSSGARVVQIVP